MEYQAKNVGDVVTYEPIKGTLIYGEVIKVHKSLNTTTYDLSYDFYQGTGKEEMKLRAYNIDRAFIR